MPSASIAQTRALPCSIMRSISSGSFIFQTARNPLNFSKHRCHLSLPDPPPVDELASRTLTNSVQGKPADAAHDLLLFSLACRSDDQHDLAVAVFHQMLAQVYVAQLPVSLG